MTVQESIQEIGALEDAVRDHINTHRYQSVLMTDSARWNQICSSLDAIGDSLYAVKSYEACEFPEDIGLQYIHLYGILQVLFVMQDAIRNLSEAFDISIEMTESLRSIRKIRNASIGHPTKQNERGIRYYNFISRISMSKSGFDLLRSSERGEHGFTRVDILKACRDQLNDVVEAYRGIAERLAEIDRMHKDTFKEAPLADIFHSAMGYFFEKVSQGVHSYSYGDREFGYRHVRLITETYERFRQALSQRGELNDYLDFDLNEYFHALKRLEEYLGNEASHMVEKDARIYVSYLRHEHEHFVTIAKEIDANYAT